MTGILFKKVFPLVLDKKPVGLGQTPPSSKTNGLFNCRISGYFRPGTTGVELSVFFRLNMIGM